MISRAELDSVTEGRNYSIVRIARYFANDHLPPELAALSTPTGRVAIDMLQALPDDDPELTTGLRKLLEAKDCFVRAGLPE